MRAPVRRLLKRDLECLGTHCCKHSHSYLEHYQCYIAEQPQDSPILADAERIGILDIETSNLTASYGYAFSYAIKTHGKDEVVGRVLRPKEITGGIFDRDLMKEFLRDINGFDRFVVYWGKDLRFDIPFLRTRCLRWELGFPTYRDFFVSDCFDLVKAKLKLHRKSLAVACDFFGIEAKSHRMSPDIWAQAMIGGKEALDHIWAHNVEDVRSTDTLWTMLKDYNRIPKTSI